MSPIENPGDTCQNKNMAPPCSRSSGNVFIYILISVFLLGVLSFAISGSKDINPSNEISDAAAKASATAILSYESQARSAVDQMIQNGASVANIDFSYPSSGTFNSGSTTLKLFHPNGGGLQYKVLPSSYFTAATIPANGYYIGKFNNYTQQTPTTAQDIVFSAYGISKKICQELNKKLTGSTTIPAASGTLSNYMVQGSNSDMTTGVCSGCDDKPSACISNAGLTAYGYYSILVAR